MTAIFLATLLPALTGGRRRAAVASSAAIATSSPAPYQTVQRDADDEASIPVSGSCSGFATAVEARFDGGAWTVIDATPDCAGSGTFGGMLPDQGVGQGELEVRIANRPAVSTTVSPVAVGDVFVIAGQSNAVMAADALYSFSHPILQAGAFTRWFTWKIGDDTIHHDPNFSSYDLGSCWPLLATLLMGNEGVPVAFIGSAVGATGLLTPPDWHPFDPAGFELYDRMLLRVGLATDGSMDVAAVLWFQGENEALSQSVSHDEYLAALTILSDAIETDLGVPIVVAVIGRLPVDPAVSEPIRQAQRDAASLQGDDNILAGPETVDLPVDPVFGIHFVSESAIRALAERWCESLSGTLYGSLDCHLESFEGGS